MTSTAPAAGGATGVCLREMVNRHCAASGTSRAAVVRAAGVTRSSFYEWLDGKDIPHAAARALAAVLGVDERDVLAAAARPACPAPATAPTQVSAYGQAVKAAAKAKGISLDKLARAAMIGRSSLFAAVNGTHQPSPEQLLAVATQLDLDVVELARLTDEPVECGADEERLRLGLSRHAYAERCKVNPDFLYGRRPTQRPDLAHRAVTAAGGDPAEAAAAAAAVRQSAARCPLGEVIEAGLDRLGITASSLSNALGVSRQALEQWIGGTSRPRPETAARLAEKLEVEMALIEAAIAAGVPPHANVGRRLRELRLQAGLRQADVAKVLGVSDPVVSSLENGTRRLTDTMAGKLTAAYGWELTDVDGATAATAAAG